MSLSPSFLPPVEEGTFSTPPAIQVWVLRVTQDHRIMLELEGLIKSFMTTRSFRAEKVEVQRGSVICPRPHSQLVSKPGLEAMFFIPCLDHRFVYNCRVCSLFPPRRR